MVLLSLCAYGAEQPLVSKKATAFRVRCFEGEQDHCTRHRIPSPDGRFAIQVRYRLDPSGLHAHTTLITPGADPQDLFLEYLNEGAGPSVEVLWAPDSRAFFVNYNKGSAISGHYLAIYRLDDRGNLIDESFLDVTDQAQQDMLVSFPPCKAADLTSLECHEMQSDPDRKFNMRGVDWIRGSSAIVVMAEVPCSSRWGGIMCQVNGYEIEVPTGNILKKMTAAEFKARWQPSLAFKFRIPAAPEYRR